MGIKERVKEEKRREVFRKNSLKSRFCCVLVSISSAQRRREKRRGSGAAIYNHTGAKKAHSFYAKKVSGEATVSQWNTDPEIPEHRGPPPASSWAASSGNSAGPVSLTHHQSLVPSSQQQTQESSGFVSPPLLASFIALGSSLSLSES